MPRPPAGENVREGLNLGTTRRARGSSGMPMGVPLQNPTPTTRMRVLSSLSRMSRFEASPLDRAMNSTGSGRYVAYGRCVAMYLSMASRLTLSSKTMGRRMWRLASVRDAAAAAPEPSSAASTALTASTRSRCGIAQPSYSTRRPRRTLAVGSRDARGQIRGKLYCIRWVW